MQVGLFLMSKMFSLPSWNNLSLGGHEDGELISPCKCAGGQWLGLGFKDSSCNIHAEEATGFKVEKKTKENMYPRYRVATQAQRFRACRIRRLRSTIVCWILVIICSIIQMRWTNNLAPWFQAVFALLGDALQNARTNVEKNNVCLWKLEIDAFFAASR